MGEIIVSRELAWFHSQSPIKVYVDGQKAMTLETEGEVQVLPLEGECVELSIREWGFRSRSVTVQSGQTALIKPRLPLVFFSYACFIAWLIFWYRWYESHPWPGENWDSPLLFWHNTWRTLLSWVPFWLHRIVTLFTIQVSDELPSGYFPVDRKTE